MGGSRVVAGGVAKAMNELQSSVPSVSVLLSCYNGARWLDKAINSVLSQTFKDFEFIIVDDGSTDNSAQIIKRFSEQDTRIVVISKDNTGLADSLNLGVQRARGLWIARLDADDVCEPTRLEKQMAKAKCNPSLVFIGSGLRVIDEEGTVLKSFRYPVSHGLLVRNLQTARKFPPHSSAFYRADAVRSVGSYRTQMRRSQDWDLWLRLSEVGRLTSLEEPLVRIRKHQDQISHDELGRRQKIDSTVARVSYWIRRKGFSDPVAGDDDLFEYFHAWVAGRLEQERCFQFFDYIAHLKVTIAGMYKSPSAFLTSMGVIFGRPRFLFRYLRWRWLGEQISCRLADEWMQDRPTSKIS